MTQKVNPVSIETYEYASGGEWFNPLNSTPVIRVHVCRAYDDADGVSHILDKVADEVIKFDPTKAIDPSKYDMPLPPITHEVFYAYFKTMILDAMTEEEEVVVPYTPPISGSN